MRNIKLIEIVIIEMAQKFGYKDKAIADLMINWSISESM